MSHRQKHKSSSGSSLSSAMGRLSVRRKDDKKTISYAAQRVIGSGSFGVVFQASVIGTGEIVAIKKVLQDRRYKNRELQIMQMIKHPCVVDLKHCFFSTENKKQKQDVYLNLVMEFIPQTVHRTLRAHAKANSRIPSLYVKAYVYQISRSLAYIHGLGICHRDIKPQNLLFSPKTHHVKLCDFGSAKILKKGEPNVAYICSRYYRAPELVFEATEYTTAVDVWSMGCVFAELILGSPVFPGESGADQLSAIIRVLGPPTPEQMSAMNPNHATFTFPSGHTPTWNSLLGSRCDAKTLDILGKMLSYAPGDRPDAFTALAHPYFDELRQPGATLPNGMKLPDLFNFTDNELRLMEQLKITDKLIPPHLKSQFPRHKFLATSSILSSKPKSSSRKVGSPQATRTQSRTRVDSRSRAQAFRSRGAAQIETSGSKKSTKSTRAPARGPRTDAVRVTPDRRRRARMRQTMDGIA